MGGKGNQEAVRKDQGKGAGNPEPEQVASVIDIFFELMDDEAH